ncbi:MAG: translocation/assembly module TamB domain-containing protein [Deltaproteobacteria bacterium]|nr:translocation/assembly module TamB domain-containing protein [Deltaproteobacteria bacterium]
MTTRPTGLRRVLRFARRTVLVVFLLALVVTLATLVIIHTGWGRGLVKAQIEATLRSSFAGGATIGELEGSVLGDFTLTNVVLNDLDGKPAITIGTLRGNLALGKLMRKTAELETLQVEDVSIKLGAAPLTKPVDDPDAEPSAWSVKLPNIDVKRGTVEYAGVQPVSIDGIAITGALTLAAGGGISATNLAIAATWRERKLPIVVSGGVELDDGVSLPEMRIKIGDLAITATGLVVDTQQPSGTIKISGSPEAIAAIAPDIEMPAGIDLEIETKPSGHGADFALRGTIGTSTLHGGFHADLERQTVSGFLGAGGLNVRRLLRTTTARPPIRVRGDLALAITVDPKGVRGIAGVRGAARDLPESDATIVIDATWREAALIVLASGAGDSLVAATAHATLEGSAITLDRARVVASAKDLAKPTGALVRVSGRELRIDAKLDKPAPLTTVMDLAFSGTVRGSRVVFDDLGLAAVDTTFDGTLRDKLLVQSTTTIRGATQKGTALGSATIAANLLADGRIYTRVDARPAAAAVGVRANGYITLGDVVTVAIGNHQITPAVGTPWSGRGGTITIDKAIDTIEVRDFVTASAGGGRAKLEVTLVGDTLDATVDATGLPAAAIDPAYRGTLSGKFAVKRRGVRWDGGGDAVAADIVIDPTLPVFNGKLRVAVAGRRVTLDAHATSPTIGGARFELDVEGPRDLTDVFAWRLLDRTAIKSALITVDKVALDAVSSTGGLIEGKIRIGGTEVEGSVEVKAVTTPLGTAEGTVSFSPIGNDLFASWNALLSDVGEANIGLRIAFPQHPFDPTAWKQLGRGIVQSLTASFDDLSIDPSKLAKLGIDAPYGGRADIRIAIGAAATAATIDVDLREIEGGELKKPIDIHFEATTDDQGTRASACVARAKDPRGDACARGVAAAAATVARLFEVTDVKLPVTFATWLVAPKTALGVVLAGKIAIPAQSAPEYFALIGRNVFDPKRGTIEGAIQIDGTLGRPTGKGTFTINNLQLLSSIAGRTIPELAQLKIDAGYNGTNVTVEMIADEATAVKIKTPKRLRAFVTARPDNIGDGVGTFSAVDFDLAPIAAMLPGELASAQGILHATITMTGFDLDTTKIRGDLHITKGHIPIHPIVGTLRDAKLNVLMSDKGIKLDARGLLNSCRNLNTPRCTENVRLDAFSPPDASTIDGTLVATQVSPIGEIEPLIDGTAKIALRRKRFELTGDIFLRKGRVYVPASTGDDLLEFEAPGDVYFTDKPPKQIRFTEARVPTKVWFDARLFVDSTQIEVEQFGVTAAVMAREPLRLRIGDTIGLDGKISVIYGSAKDLFGRKYEIEQNDIVFFDGTIDPIIDLQMSTQMREMRLTVIVQGALSDPRFPDPRFVAEPAGQYNRDQLFGFFLGGEPGGNVSDAVGKVGVSVASQYILKKLKNVLPEKLRIDVLACESSTSTSAGSCTIGRRLFDGKVYVALKHRLTPAPTENAEEVLLQYYLSTEWFVEGSGGTANVIGADLLWRRRW